MLNYSLNIIFGGVNKRHFSLSEQNIVYICVQNSQSSSERKYINFMSGYLLNHKNRNKSFFKTLQNCFFLLFTTKIKVMFCKMTFAIWIRLLRNKFHYVKCVCVRVCVCVCGRERGKGKREDLYLVVTFQLSHKMDTKDISRFPLDTGTLF